MPHLLCIVGPTAVGKSTLAHELAKQWGTHIISCDARQIYRQMDIGTDKVSKALRAEVPYHFIDILEPHEKYTVGQYETEVMLVLEELFQRKKLERVIMVGGSTLYADALWHGIDEMPNVPLAVREQLQTEHEQKGLLSLLKQLAEVDPKTYDKIDRQNPARVLRALEVYRASGKPISHFQKGKSLKNTFYKLCTVGLDMDRKTLYEKINARVEEMIQQGLEEEVKKLLELGYTAELQAMRSIGYKEMIQYLAGEITKAEAIHLIQQNSRRYAKRQLTYFNKFKHITWFHPNQRVEIQNWIEAQMR